MANLALRFILELCALGALGYWGFHNGNGWLFKIILGVGAPVLAAVVWGLFVSPKATYAIGDPARLAVEMIVFGSAAAALYFSGQIKLCSLFVIAAVVSRILISVFKQ